MERSSSIWRRRSRSSVSMNLPGRIKPPRGGTSAKSVPAMGAHVKGAGAHVVGQFAYHLEVFVPSRPAAAVVRIAVLLGAVTAAVAGVHAPGRPPGRTSA